MFHSIKIANPSSKMLSLIIIRLLRAVKFKMFLCLDLS